MAVGLAYDLWLKRSAWSSLAYAVALPLVPVWVWTALGRFTPALLWVWPIGLLLGGALHLANALPDLDADAAHGVRGAVQRLGRRRALAAAWGGYGGAVLLALALGLALGHARGPLLAGTGAAGALLAAAVTAYAVRPGAGALQAGWTLLAPGAGALAVGWLAGLR
ncbi:MAG: UbiA family prenyltransferase [Dehalococcoidia bacterium]